MSRPSDPLEANSAKIAEIRGRAKRCLAETAYPVGAWDTSQAAAKDVLLLVEVAEAAQELLRAADIRYASDDFRSLRRLEEALTKLDAR